MGIANAIITASGLFTIREVPFSGSPAYPQSDVCFNYIPALEIALMTQTDTTYPSSGTGFKAHAERRPAFTRFDGNKPAFTSAVTEQIVPFGLFTTFKVQIGTSDVSTAQEVRLITRMPYNNAAIPPPEEITGSASLPRKDSYGQ